MFLQKDDEIIRMDYGQRVLMDVLDAARRPDSYAVILLDMSAAEAFRDEYRKKHGVSLTSLHLIIKSFALMLQENPWMNYMMDGYKIIKPSSIDIGVSVAAEESVTPVVVIKEANKKSLKEICKELKRKANEAVEKEKENLENLNRLARWIPFNFVRRRIVRFLVRRYRIRRATVGTAQITSLGFKDLAFHLPSHMGTTMLLSVGGIARRPIVVGDRIEIRPTVYVAFQVDTRLIHAKKTMRAIRRFRRRMEHPDEMVEPGGEVENLGIRPKISVIIPAYNEEKYLGATIENVKQAIREYQKTYSLPVEVIVVNNNSTDRTDQVAREHGVRAVFEAKNQIAIARNAGGRAARGEIVTFLDADSHISLNLLTTVHEVMSSGQYIGGGVAWVYRDKPSLWATILGVTRDVIGRRIFGVSTGLIYTSKETFDKLGGFDERYYAAEEGRFILDLKKLGKKEGKKFCNIKEGYVITSARKFEQLKAPMLLWTGLKFVLFPWKFRDRKACSFWYDIQERK